MYSEKIKAIKPNIDTDRKIQSTEKTEKLLRQFCTKDDAIGAPCKQLLDIFDQFCKDYGHPLISRNHTGNVLCKTVCLPFSFLRGPHPAFTYSCGRQ